MTYDPLNREHQAAAKAQQETRKHLDREQLASDTQWLMSDPRGRRLMRQWLADCHIDRTTFTGNSTGMFLEGERNAGLRIKQQITSYAFEQYLLRLREMQPEAPKPE